MPQDWEALDGESPGLLNGLFLLPPGADPDDFRFSSHVALELLDEPPFGEGPAPDFSNEAVQKDYFTHEIVSTYSKMGCPTSSSRSGNLRADTFTSHSSNAATKS